MTQLGFYYDMTICTGCKTCQIACNDKNDLGVNTLFREVQRFDGGAFPEPWFYHLSLGCNHCEKPACVAACPMRALEFGPIDELRTAHPEATDTITVLPEPSTGPSIAVEAKPAALEPNPASVLM